MFEETPLKDTYLYRPPVYKDERGSFTESFNKKHFEQKGLSLDFVQDNRSISKKGTLRGLHFQAKDSSQAKLVGVIRGKVLDVAVDLREKSPTFKKWHSVELSEGDGTYFFVPRGFAHGFIVLSEEAEFFYKCDNYYNKEAESGIIYNDPELGIDWKLSPEELTLSDKDKVLPSLNNIEYF